MNHTYEKCGCGEVHVSTRPETLRYVDKKGQLWTLACFLRAVEDRLYKLDERVSPLEDEVPDLVFTHTR